MEKKSWAGWKSTSIMPILLYSVMFQISFHSFFLVYHLYFITNCKKLQMHTTVLKKQPSHKSRAISIKKKEVGLEILINKTIPPKYAPYCLKIWLLTCPKRLPCSASQNLKIKSTCLFFPCQRLSSGESTVILHNILYRILTNNNFID